MILPKQDIVGRASCRGFTLVEVMVALGILAFGILAIASMQTSALSGTSRANFITDATNVAMNRVEQIWPLTYSQTLIQGGTLNQGIYTITTTVTPNSPVVNTARVNVTVAWNEKGLAKSTQLTFIKNQL